MSAFELVEPRTLAEAVRLLDRDDPAVRPISGGTALMLLMRTGLFQPRRLVSMRRIEAKYSRLAVESDGALRIGAMVRLGAIERSPEVRRLAPAITGALKRLSNVRVRNVATLGGHLAHGDPHMDLPPLLAALGARLVIVGPKGERGLAVEDLITGYLETTLARDEAIAEVIVPRRDGKRAAYMKVTARSADDWPALGIAVAFDSDGRTMQDGRIFIGAATDRPTRLTGAEQVLRGSALDDGVLRKAGEAAADEAALFGDQHGSAAYKRQLLKVYLGRAVRAALAAGNGAAP